MILFRGKESNPRSSAKAASWRAVGSVDTFPLNLFFTRGAGAAGAIASTEVFTKIMLYFVQEQAWAQFGWGLSHQADKAAQPEFPGFAEAEAEARAAG